MFVCFVLKTKLIDELHIYIKHIAVNIDLGAFFYQAMLPCLIPVLLEIENLYNKKREWEAEGVFVAKSLKNLVWVSLEFDYL